VVRNASLRIHLRKTIRNHRQARLPSTDVYYLAHSSSKSSRIAQERRKMRSL
jgi:hypothetical protein